MKRLCALFAVAWFAGSCASVVADVRLPAVIGNNMVLQRDSELPIWGWADPGEKVTVAFEGKTAETTAAADGTWKVKLPAFPAGGPYKMTVTGKKGIELKNILVGEVWVGSGQSNMEWPVAISKDAATEIPAAKHSSIRLFHVPKKTAGAPEADVQAQWVECSPESIPGFSATLYYFGREIHLSLSVPVGLINASWGGSRIEPWTPVVGFASIPEVKEVLTAVQDAWGEYATRIEAFQKSQKEWLATARAAVAEGKMPTRGPTVPQHPLDAYLAPTSMYNAMVAPVAPFAIRGAIWYQGESNRGEGMVYHHKMRALISGWRQIWGRGDFPFLFVQLAPFRYGGSEVALPEIWEAQTATLSVPNTGMAVTTDITTINDIHPPNKKDVGKRLSRWALANTYGKKEIVVSGPLYAGMETSGGSVRVKFKYAEGGLKTPDGKPVTWFSIAGSDKKFVPATATIEGETIVVSSPDVKQPVAVRFGWHQLAEPNLFNSSGLPASPFRTDDWTDATNAPGPQ
jgi:sialate O-acetylesterase